MQNKSIRDVFLQISSLDIAQYASFKRMQSFLADTHDVYLRQWRVCHLTRVNWFGGTDTLSTVDSVDFL